MSDGLSKREIRRIIDSYRMVSDGKLVRYMSEFNPSSYRILEEPLPISLSNDLISGSWTMQALSEKYGIHIHVIREFMRNLMNDYSILELGYIPRRMRSDTPSEKKSTLLYSYVPIPINARIFDPTLGFSMLKWLEYFDWDYSDNIVFPTDELNDIYSEQIAGYWDVPKDKVLKVLDKFQQNRNLKYCISNYGLLPIINDKNTYSSIEKQLSEEESVRNQKYYHKNINSEYSYLSNLIDRGDLSIPEIEECVILIYDSLSHFASVDTEWYAKYQDLNEQLFQAIFMTQSE